LIITRLKDNEKQQQAEVKRLSEENLQILKYFKTVEERVHSLEAKLEKVENHSLKAGSQRKAISQIENSVDRLLKIVGHSGTTTVSAKKTIKKPSNSSSVLVNDSTMS
jgi:predicted RNase H-like nuclease (RuvC/YqgF family)